MMSETPALMLRSLSDNDMTPEKALEIGRAIGKSYKTVCVGSDTYPSSPMIKSALISGLLSVGADVNDAGIAPAPAVAFAAKNAECAVMVSEPDEQGIISGIEIMNPNGSIFTKEQIREIVRKNDAERVLPDYKGVGIVRVCDSVIADYNRKMRERFDRSIDSQIILGCGCGSASLSAPHILSAMGADVTTVNAQIDARYNSRPPGIKRNDITGLIEIVNIDLGSIGIALNGNGTKIGVIDEEGNYVDPESVLALMLLYLKPSSVVVPFSASAVIDDAFSERIGGDMRTDAKPGKERRIIRAENNLEAITTAIKENNAEMGALNDGMFIFPDVTLCPDAINAAAVISNISGENSISNLLASFPKYIVLRESLHYTGNQELFSKKLTERLADLDIEEVWEIDGWRVGMSQGWFTVSKNSEDPDYIDITAEAKDKAYAVSMMELAKGLVRGCM